MRRATHLIHHQPVDILRRYIRQSQRMSQVLLLFVLFSNGKGIFIPRRYASAVYAVVVSLRLSIRPSHAGIVPKRLNVGSRKQRRTIAQTV